MKTRTVFLSPSEPQLSGKYSSGDFVLIKCDATDEAFAVNVPDALQVRDVIFVFIKTDSTANVVTLDGYETQTLNAAGAETIALSTQGACKILVPDTSNYQTVAGV